MTEVSRPNSIVNSNYFEVINEITIKSLESVNKAKSTYDIVLKTNKNEKQSIEINRLKFLVNDAVIENKFPLLSHLYFESIFPLQFNVIEDRLKLSNYKEIKNRISEVDNLLTVKYKGKGIDYIRVSFLKQVENETVANTFISSLGFINIINLSLRRYIKEDGLPFNWKIPSIGTTVWSLNSEENLNNTVVHAANQINKTDFFNALNHHRRQHKYDTIEEEEINLESNFSTTIEYENNNLDIMSAETNCEIKLGKYFEYEENISIKSLL